MADARNVVGHGGGEEYRTYKIDDSTITYSATVAGGSSQVGLAVNFSTDDTVQLAGDGEAIIGKLIKVSKDLKATVQVAGEMELPAGTGAALTLGKKIVGDLLVAAKGYIREVATGTAAELGLCRGYIINNDDTANVWVRLE